MTNNKPVPGLYDGKSGSLLKNAAAVTAAEATSSLQDFE